MIGDQTAADEYREIAGRFTALVEGVPDDATWNRRSPVPGGSPATSSATSSSGSPASSPAAPASPSAGPRVDDDPVAAWRTMSDGVQALLDDPASAATRCATRTSARSRWPRRSSRFYTADVFMHTWDLARATGQDETLDPDAARSCSPAWSRSTSCCARAASTAPGSRSRRRRRADPDARLHRPRPPAVERHPRGPQRYVSWMSGTYSVVMGDRGRLVFPPSCGSG